MRQPGIYENAYLDAAVVNGLFGKSREPFWQQAYTSVIRWIRTAAEVNGTREPDLREIAALALDDEKLNALIEQTAEHAGAKPKPAESGRPAPRARAGAPKTDEETARHIGREVRRWYEHDWCGLDPRLRKSIAEGLRWPQKRPQRSGAATTSGNRSRSAAGAARGTSGTRQRWRGRHATPSTRR